MKQKISKTAAIQGSIAIFFAFALFFIAETKEYRQSSSSALTTSLSTTKTTIEDVPINFIYDAEKYYLDIKIDTVDVIISTDNKVAIERAKKETEITIDLREKEASMQYQLLLNDYVNIFGSDASSLATDIGVSTSPEYITVGIVARDQQTFPITVTGYEELVNETQQQLRLSTSVSEVKVSGASDDIEKIQSIVAVVSPTEMIEDKFEEEVSLLAIDSENNILQDVTINPETVVVTLEPTKEVPIEVTIENSDDEIEASLSEESIVISGPQEELDTIDSIPITIDASEVKEDKKVKVKVSLDNDKVSLLVNEIEAELKVNTK